MGTSICNFQEDGTMGLVPHTSTINEQSNRCAGSTKIYEGTLALSRYESFTGNTQKTVRLQCYITFTGLSFVNRTSSISENVIFAGIFNFIYQNYMDGELKYQIYRENFTDSTKFLHIKYFLVIMVAMEE